jgi:Peptidase M16 inactive domain
MNACKLCMHDGHGDGHGDASATAAQLCGAVVLRLEAQCRCRCCALKGCAVVAGCKARGCSDVSRAQQSRVYRVPHACRVASHAIRITPRACMRRCTPRRSGASGGVCARLIAARVCMQFFIEPLISVSGIERERRAVDSEHSKNLQSDVWRQQELWHTSAAPEHPLSRFFTGNLETLAEAPEAAGLDVHAALWDFYHAQYSADRMKLCVLGRESVDELQAIVEGLFAAVPNKRAPLQPRARSRAHRPAAPASPL